VSAQPFSDEDIALLDDGMRELEEMNRAFLDLAVAKAQSSVHRELGGVSSNPSSRI
jgi:hypothetical protein